VLNIYGNTTKLPDGRVFQKQSNGFWKDINTRIQMNEIQLINLMYSNAFYGIPDDGRPYPYRFNGPRGRAKTFTTGYLWITAE